MIFPFCIPQVISFHFFTRANVACAPLPLKKSSSEQAQIRGSLNFCVNTRFI